MSQFGVLNLQRRRRCEFESGTTVRQCGDEAQEGRWEATNAEMWEVVETITIPGNFSFSMPLGAFGGGHMVYWRVVLCSRCTHCSGCVLD
jgi:hypothetical protein